MLGERNDILWLAFAGLLLLGTSAVLALNSWRFGYEFAVADMPILALVAVLVVAGLGYCISAASVWRLTTDLPKPRQARKLLWWVILVGALARLLLFASEPILEDDYQRYLWDGAVTAAGHNPYRLAPAAAGDVGDPELSALTIAAGVTLERVNHPEIRTIYPPGAQFFFALAHTIEPFSLSAWRIVVMAADAVTLALVLLLLRAARRPMIWATLYWWNPLLIKELANSVHMEAVLLPFVLLAVWFAVRNRPLLATATIAIAGAIKIWPLALFPVLIRASTSRPMVLLAGLALLGGITAAWATPMILAGLDQTAGVVAYAERWRTNSAMFEVLLRLAQVSGLAGLSENMTDNHVARIFIAIIVVFIGVTAAMDIPETPLGTIRRVGVVTIAVFLLSPAQFPWYVAWIAPFLPFLPIAGLIALAVTMPLYYVAFHLMAADAYAHFNSIVIWCVWLPVWGLLMVQLLWPDVHRSMFQTKQSSGDGQPPP